MWESYTLRTNVSLRLKWIVKSNYNDVAICLSIYRVLNFIDSMRIWPSNRMDKDKSTNKVKNRNSDMHAWSMGFPKEPKMYDWLKENVRGTTLILITIPLQTIMIIHVAFTTNWRSKCYMNWEIRELKIKAVVLLTTLGIKRVNRYLLILGVIINVRYFLWSISYSLTCCFCLGFWTGEHDTEWNISAVSSDYDVSEAKV